MAIDQTFSIKEVDGFNGENFEVCLSNGEISPPFSSWKEAERWACLRLGVNAEPTTEKASRDHAPIPLYGRGAATVDPT